MNGFICSLLSENSVGEVINLGSNFEISIKETVDLISKIIFDYMLQILLYQELIENPEILFVKQSQKFIVCL